MIKILIEVENHHQKHKVKNQKQLKTQGWPQRQQKINNRHLKKPMGSIRKMIGIIRPKWKRNG
tara:strand:- start:251 stop:439 length:189 start_codon:yes stop_codon:yes gene_type:complete